jgi:hypothetical protein
MERIESASMLGRLDKRARLKAGWCIALAYLFCVLAPSLSFAFADATRSAPCLIEDHGPGMDMHGAAQHLHDAAAAHSHVHMHGASSDHAGVMAQHDEALPVKDQHKTTDTRCCGLVSVSAIPAGETVLIEPAFVASRCATEGSPFVAGNAPPTPYRPPIS